MMRTGVCDCYPPLKKDRLIRFTYQQNALCICILNSFWGRFWGAQRFLYKKSWVASYTFCGFMPVLFFPRSQAVHQFFSRYSLYVVFIDEYGQVLQRGILRPGRIMVNQTAYGVLECLPKQRLFLDRFLLNDYVVRRLIEVTL